jgi:hypothetical protein
MHPGFEMRFKVVGNWLSLVWHMSIFDLASNFNLMHLSHLHFTAWYKISAWSFCSRQHWKALVIMLNGIRNCGKKNSVENWLKISCVADLHKRIMSTFWLAPSRADTAKNPQAPLIQYRKGNRMPCKTYIQFT